MMSQRTETITTLFVSVVLGVALIVAVRFFAGMSEDNTRILSVVLANAERLEALENNKAKATAKRFTADDYLALSQCLRVPYKDREACLEQIDRAVANR